MTDKLCVLFLCSIYILAQDKIVKEEKKLLMVEFQVSVTDLWEIF